MKRRTSLAAALAVALTAATSTAGAAGAWIGGPSFAPVEQRVAVAVGPARTTVWTSLRFTSAGGPAAIVVPVPPGASLDRASDAWFEALEVATAPRIFPPDGAVSTCPGAAGVPYQLDGQVEHLASVPPVEVVVLADLAAVAAWAAAAGLDLPPDLAAGLSLVEGARFLAARFDAPSGAGVTPALRVVMPGAAAVLPLALTRAGDADLPVTAWVLGAGRADLSGGAEVLVGPLAWQAAAGTSDYDAQRAGVLAGQPDRYLVEAASHDALADSLSVAYGAATLDAAVGTYFDRAAAYGDADPDSAACIAAAVPILAASAPVAASCPRAALGVVDPAAPCQEAPAPGEADPAALRCGPGADDLAVALGGLAPAGVWITRLHLSLGAGAPGLSLPLELGAGAVTMPVLTAATVDAAGCLVDGGASSSSSSGDPFVDPDWAPIPGSGDPGYGGAGGQDAVDLGGSSSGSGSGSCDCDAEAVGAGLEACAQVAGALGDIDCSVGGARHPRGPRFSILLMAMLVVLVPLRRRGRARRRG
jgi:hypothetical protein